MLPFITGCSKYCYQVFQMKSETVQSHADNLKYNNEDCSVIYNLWGANGNPGFTIYNHTDENIYIDLNQTHFIRNGVAYDYFLNREYQTGHSNTIGVSTSKSMQGTFYNYGAFVNPHIGDAPSYQKSASVSASNAVTNSKSITYKEKDIICIPPKSSKSFFEYIITDKAYFDCDLVRQPKDMHMKKLQFVEENTPLMFSNVIAYQKDGDSAYNYIENKFYVESIEVLKTKDMFVKKEFKNPCEKTVVNNTKINNSSEDEQPYLDPLFSTRKSQKIYISKSSYETITIAPLYAPERFYLRY